MKLQLKRIYKADDLLIHFFIISYYVRLYYTFSLFLFQQTFGLLIFMYHQKKLQFYAFLCLKNEY